MTSRAILGWLAGVLGLGALLTGAIQGYSKVVFDRFIWSVSEFDCEFSEFEHRQKANEQRVEFVSINLIENDNGTKQAHLLKLFSDLADAHNLSFSVRQGCRDFDVYSGGRPAAEQIEAALLAAENMMSETGSLMELFGSHDELSEVISVFAVARSGVSVERASLDLSLSRSDVDAGLKTIIAPVTAEILMSMPPRVLASGSIEAEFVLQVAQHAGEAAISDESLYRSPEILRLAAARGLMARGLRDRDVPSLEVAAAHLKDLQQNVSDHSTQILAKLALSETYVVLSTLVLPEMREFYLKTAVRYLNEGFGALDRADRVQVNVATASVYMLLSRETRNLEAKRKYTSTAYKTLIPILTHPGVPAGVLERARFLLAQNRIAAALQTENRERQLQFLADAEAQIDRLEVENNSNNVQFAQLRADVALMYFKVETRPEFLDEGLRHLESMSSIAVGFADMRTIDVLKYEYARLEELYRIRTHKSRVAQRQKYICVLIDTELSSVFQGWVRRGGSPFCSGTP